MLKTTIALAIFGIPIIGGSIFLFVCIIRALLKYIHSKDVRNAKQATRVSLGETIKAHRMRCQMTQEFVADALGVSRQSVSKWETDSACSKALKYSILRKDSFMNKKITEEGNEGNYI